MAAEILFRPEVYTDIDTAYRWYEKQKQGLGDAFLETFDEAFMQIQNTPEAFQVIHRNVRRKLTKRFPYAIFFLHSDGQIVVIAVLHTRRDTRHWQGRV